MPLSRRDEKLLTRTRKLATKIGHEVRLVYRLLRRFGFFDQIELDGLVRDGEPVRVPEWWFVRVMVDGRRELAKNGWDSALPLVGKKLLGDDYAPELDPVIEYLLKKEVLRFGKSGDDSGIRAANSQ